MAEVIYTASHYIHIYIYRIHTSYVSLCVYLEKKPIPICSEIVYIISYLYTHIYSLYLYIYIWNTQAVNRPPFAMKQRGKCWPFFLTAGRVPAWNPVRCRINNLVGRTWGGEWTNHPDWHTQYIYDFCLNLDLTGEIVAPTYVMISLPRIHGSYLHSTTIDKASSFSKTCGKFLRLYRQLWLLQNPYITFKYIQRNLTTGQLNTITPLHHGWYRKCFCKASSNCKVPQSSQTELPPAAPPSAPNSQLGRTVYWLVCAVMAPSAIGYSDLEAGGWSDGNHEPHEKKWPKRFGCLGLYIYIYYIGDDEILPSFFVGNYYR